MSRRYFLGITAVWSSPFGGHGKSFVLLRILKASPLIEESWVQYDRVLEMIWHR